MNLLTPQDFKRQKKSNTLVIFGCGYSINKLSKEDIMKLTQYDSVGFN